MASRTIVVVTDDLDHSTDNVRTYRFALDGVEYEIDLSPSNQQRMREALAPYVAAGRRLPRPTARRRGPATRAGGLADADARKGRATPEQGLALPRHGRPGSMPHEARAAHQDAPPRTGRGAR
ncbi:histone-like nucleoid-structuring protein Lsr2 [Micromonospora sp. KLBMP9576]|uniref:histone-like nucleoid-structuring protein Lsr2 n=1 Tax=Micromonospora sp. KLBMP9576 TaxID=3424769 RepID=UPI003D8A0B70